MEACSCGRDDSEAVFAVRFGALPVLTEMDSNWWCFLLWAGQWRVVYFPIANGCWHVVRYTVLYPSFRFADVLLFAESINQSIYCFHSLTHSLIMSEWVRGQRLWPYGLPVCCPLWLMGVGVEAEEGQWFSKSKVLPLSCPLPHTQTNKKTHQNETKRKINECRRRKTATRKATQKTKTTASTHIRPAAETRRRKWQHGKRHRRRRGRQYLQAADEIYKSKK